MLSQGVRRSFSASHAVKDNSARLNLSYFNKVKNLDKEYEHRIAEEAKNTYKGSKYEPEVNVLEDKVIPWITIGGCTLIIIALYTSTRTQLKVGHKNPTREPTPGEENKPKPRKGH